MNTITTVLIGLIMFMLLILFHELGHFAVAKWTGIKVNEFSIGMGPKIKQSKKGETTYSLRAIPIGGYVAMEGEDQDSPDPRSFENAKPWQRFLTILAGPLMNFILAFFVLSLIIGIRGIPSTQIGQVYKGLPAEEAGIYIGDKILEIEGDEVKEFSDISLLLNKELKNEYLFTVDRAGEKIDIKVQPIKEDDNLVIGVTPLYVKDIGASIKEGFNQLIFLTGQLWKSLAMIFRGEVGLNNVSGPIGVVQMMSQTAKDGVLNFMFFFAFLSINLGFFNLLPIPALDGSKLLFIAIEKLIGRPINKEIQEKITIVGFILLMVLIIVVSFKDIINIFRPSIFYLS